MYQSCKKNDLTPSSTGNSGTTITGNNTTTSGTNTLTGDNNTSVAISPQTTSCYMDNGVLKKFSLASGNLNNSSYQLSSYLSTSLTFKTSMVRGHKSFRIDNLSILSKDVIKDTSIYKFGVDGEYSQYPYPLLSPFKCGGGLGYISCDGINCVGVDVNRCCFTDFAGAPNVGFDDTTTYYQKYYLTCKSSKSPDGHIKFKNLDNKNLLLTVYDYKKGNNYYFLFKPSGVAKGSYTLVADLDTQSSDTGISGTGTGSSGSGSGSSGGGSSSGSGSTNNSTKYGGISVWYSGKSTSIGISIGISSDYSYSQKIYITPRTSAPTDCSGGGATFTSNKAPVGTCHINVFDKTWGINIATKYATIIENGCTIVEIKD